VFRLRGRNSACTYTERSSATIWLSYGVKIKSLRHCLTMPSLEQRPAEVPTKARRVSEWHNLAACGCSVLSAQSFSASREQGAIAFFPAAIHERKPI
jgi:hypothetical protein